MVNLRELSVKKMSAAVGALVILVGGGAYYYYVYLPQMEKESAGAAHQAVKSPAGENTAKPPIAQRPPAASAVPALVAASAPMPVATATTPMQPANAIPSNVATTALTMPLKPAMEPASELVKPEPAMRKSAAKMPRNKTHPAQPAKMGSEPGVPVTSQQITPPSTVVLPESGAAAEPVGIVSLKYNDILTAALRGDRDAVKQLLDFGRWVDKPGNSGLTPLMAAVMNRDAQMVQLLLEHGAEPSAQALKLARKNNDAATILFLEQHGAR